MTATAACGSSDDHSAGLDPLRGDQWYLSGSADNPDWVHINLTRDAYKGDGVTVALVDDGFDIEHPDLRDRFVAYNHSYVPAEYGPYARAHGTACAGLLGATEGNDVGIRGVAPHVRLLGLNAVRFPAVATLADALTKHLDEVWVSSNSWGDFDGWGAVFDLRAGIELALERGVYSGRGGLGVVYVFAAGNGRGESGSEVTDNVNYSGYVNNRFVIPVCAVGPEGKRTNYSEVGATLLLCAPSSDGTQTPFATTDTAGDAGFNDGASSLDYADADYTHRFGGTSAATPLVAGVAALVLEANPQLGWRDVRSILALTARKVDPDDSDWVINGAGHPVNHKYGFGLVDADAAIELASRWNNLGQERAVESSQLVGAEIPDGDEVGVESAVEIWDEFAIEFVEVVLSASDHPSFGDLEVILKSPQGTVSVLAERHSDLMTGVPRAEWRFGSARHLDESSRGTWTLTVRDRRPQNIGSWSFWTLRLYGAVAQVR